MSATVPLAARLDSLNQIVSLVLSGNAKLHLLGSSLTVSDATTLALCAAKEATWPGYSAATLQSWTAATDPSGPIGMVSAFATFVPTGSGITQSVYGYYMTDSTSTKFYLVENFSSGPVVILVGQPYVPTLQYQLLSEY